MFQILKINLKKTIFHIEISITFAKFFMGDHIFVN